MKGFLNRFKKTKEVRYGDNRTIHHNGYLDVEIYKGTVVAVWFRCLPLPFKETRIDADRAKSLKGINETSFEIKAVIIEEKENEST